MKMFKKDIVLLYEEEKAILYYLPTGRLKLLKRSDAEIIEVVLENYFSGSLSEPEEKQFEDYIEKFIGGERKIQELYVDASLNQVNSLYRLEILLTNKCNLNCKYCYADGGSYGLPLQCMKSDNLELYLNNLFPERFAEVRRVMFFGGEPLMNVPAIKQTCFFFKNLLKENRISRLPQYSLVTNGTLITPDVARFLVDEDIQVTVSLDGPKKINDQLRIYVDQSGTFEKVSRGINLILKYGGKNVAIEATYTKLHEENGYTKKQIKDFLEEQFSGVRVMIPNCTGETSLAMDVDATNSCSTGDISRIRLGTVLSRLKSRKYRDYSCGSGLDSFILMPDGDIYPCHQLIKNKQYCLGNALEPKGIGSFCAANRKIQSVRRDILEPCRTCWARELCAFCPADALLRKDQFFKPKYCDQKRASIQKVLFRCFSQDSIDSMIESCV